MLSIQEGAKEIYSDSPKSVYFLTGPEYGVKKQYIDVLAKHYDGLIENQSNFADLIETFSKKSLIPRPNKVYVIRYDKDFISKIDENILKLNIPGTILGIYEDDSDEAKLDKKFPKNTLRINRLSKNIMSKHLSKQFEGIPSTLIETISSITDDFYKAQLVCQSLMNLSSDMLHSISKSEVKSLFGYNNQYDTSRFKDAILHRNFKAAINEIDAFEGDLSLLLYDILSVFINISKILDKPEYNSYNPSNQDPDFAKNWNIYSVKRMYDIAYEQLEMLRNYSSYSPYVSLIYICSLLKFEVR